ncbi:MAG TPA: hypothetical protein VL326_37670 [Kofleriaceae bacterium]|nr:hypothetical protein [Kofleriaceae bacterium]
MGTAAALAEPIKMAAPTAPQPMVRRQEAHLGRLTLQPSSKGAKQKKAVDAPRLPGDWVELADATPAKHGTEFVVVGAQQGSFGQLRINAANGRTTVRSVRVVYSDGSTKVVKVGAKLAPNGRKFAQVDLGASKPIAQLEVTTDRQGNGEYTVYGSSGGGTGAVVSSR